MAAAVMHWFVPPAIHIPTDSSSNEQRHARGSSRRTPPALWLSPRATTGTAAASIAVFTPVAADSNLAFSPLTRHERASASSVKKQPSRFPFDDHAAAAAVVASPAAAAVPVTVSCLSPFKASRSSMQMPVTPVAVMQLCAPVAAAAAPPRHQLSPDQQALRSFLLSPTCAVFRHSGRPVAAGHCRSSSASVVDSDPLSAMQLQSMLHACELTAHHPEADSASPAPLVLALSHLRWLESLHLVFHSVSELVDALRELTLQSQHAVREITQLLVHEFAGAASSAPHAVAATAAASWTILLESGASVDSPFFLRLLFSQRRCAPSTPDATAASACSSPLPQPLLSLSELVSMLQSFVKHFAQETREPLVSLLQQHRCEWNLSPQPQPQQPLQPQSTDLNQSAPHVHMSADAAPPSSLVSLAALALALPSTPPPLSCCFARVSSPTAVVHRLFMQLGPAHVDRLRGVCEALLQAGVQQSPQPHPPSPLGAHMPGLSAFAVDGALRPLTKLSWTQLSAAAMQRCLQLAAAP